MADELTLSLKFGTRTFDDVGSGIEEFIRALQQVWQGEAKHGRQVLWEHLTHVARLLAQKHGTPWPGGTSDDTLSRRTGQSVDSILHSVKVTGTTWERLSGTIGGRKSLYIHEYGGTIDAKGKLLTIPLPAALSPQGTAPPFARQWKNTFVAESRRGNLLIFQRRGATIVPLYLLVQRVRIKPRLGMRRTLEEQMPYFVERAADLIARDFIQQLGG